MSTLSGHKASRPADDTASYRLWKRWDESDFGRGTQARYYRVELAKSGYPTLRGLRILELGFGNGEFCAFSISEGAEWCGTELDAELVQRARKRGLPAYQEAESITEIRRHGPFHLIVAWDVFEHVPRPELARLFSGCRALLCPSGAVVGRIPSGDSPFSSAIQSGDLSHYPALGSAAIRFLATQCGFSRVVTRAASFPVFGYGAKAAARRMLVRTTDHVVHPIIRLLMRSRHAVLTPNMVFVLRL
jgi:SAM-dependent methyltransferase